MRRAVTVCNTLGKYSPNHFLGAFRHRCFRLGYVLGHVSDDLAKINGKLHVHVGSPDRHERIHVTVEPPVVAFWLDFQLDLRFF